MGRSTLPLLPLFFTLLYISVGSATAAVASTNFIEASCKATTYPALCVQSLSAYASTIQRSPRELAQTALNVSLARAQSTKTFVTKLAQLKGLKHIEYEAIQDCLEEMRDTVDRLGRSVRELKSMRQAGREDFMWHMSNVETWVSSALTDDNTCLDGYSGRALDGKIKDSVRAGVTKLAQVTSNALALVNNFASKY